MAFAKSRRSSFVYDLELSRGIGTQIHFRGFACKHDRATRPPFEYRPSIAGSSSRTNVEARAERRVWPPVTCNADALSHVLVQDILVSRTSHRFATCIEQDLRPATVRSVPGSRKWAVNIDVLLVAPMPGTDIEEHQMLCAVELRLWHRYLIDSAAISRQRSASTPRNNKLH
jgi:hypothetical protein